MPSARVSQQQVCSLLMAGEVHGDTPTSHISWEDSKWLTLKSIRQFAVWFADPASS